VSQVGLIKQAGRPPIFADKSRSTAWIRFSGSLVTGRTTETTRGAIDVAQHPIGASSTRATGRTRTTGTGTATVTAGLIGALGQTRAPGATIATGTTRTIQAGCSCPAAVATATATTAKVIVR
jgi:hypothetical protein